MARNVLEAFILARSAPAGLILHVGAGLAAPFPDGPPEGLRMILVEADPDRAAVLARHRHGQAAVTVRTAAVAPEAGPATLHCLSPGDFSSLHAPKRLGEVYPGLGPAEELPVDAVALADLLAEAPSDGAAANWLILDAPGDEAGLFEAFAAAPGASTFAHVLIRATREPFYEGPAFDPDAIGRAGFEIVDAWRDADPDWLWYAACRKPPLREVVPEETALLQRDLRVAMRSQALAEDDLRDLRARYAAVLDERTRQEALIGKLAARLGEASDWLHRAGPPGPGADGTARLPEKERAPRKDDE